MKIVRIHQKSIVVQEVVLLKGNINYTELHFVNGDKIVLAKTLKSLHESFSIHGFFRISKTNIINLNFLDRTCENYQVVIMKNNLELNVSRRRRTDLKGFIFQTLNQKLNHEN